MITSGTTLIATTSGATKMLLDSTPSPGTRLLIINEGTQKGWVSVTGKTAPDYEWIYVPAASATGPSSIEVDVAVTGMVWIKPASGDMTGVYGQSY